VTAPSFNPDQILAQASWIRKVVRSMLADEHLADDLAQEALETGLRHGSAIRGSTRSWLYKVAKNLHRQFLRGQQRREIREAKVAVPEHQSVSQDSVEKVEIMHIVQAAVLALPNASRDLLISRYYENLSVPEMARRHGIPVPTMESRLHGAKKLLRAQLKNRLGHGWATAVIPLAGGLPTGGLSISPLSVILMSKLTKVAALLIVALIFTAVFWPDADPSAVEPTSAKLEARRAGASVPVAPASETLHEDHIRLEQPPSESGQVIGDGASPLSGVVRAESRPVPDAIIKLGEIQVTTDAAGLFFFKDAELGAELFVSCEGWTPWHGVVEESPMEIKLEPTINFAIHFPDSNDLAVTYRIFALSWSADRMLRFQPNLDRSLLFQPLVQNVIAEGQSILDGGWKFFPNSNGSPFGFRGYIVELGSEGVSTYTYFHLPGSQTLPAGTDSSFIVATPTAPLADPSNPDILIRFLDTKGNPIAGKPAYIPSGHAFPRIWFPTTTDAQGEVRIPASFGPLVLNNVFTLVEEGQALSGKFAGMSKESPNLWIVNDPGHDMYISVRGQVPKGSWVEVKQYGLEDDGGSSGSAFFEWLHAWNRLEKLNKQRVLLSCLSTKIDVRARLMPSRVKIGSIETEFHSGMELNFEIGNLHRLSVKVDRSNYNAGELRLSAVRIENRRQAFSGVIPAGADSLEIEVNPGEYFLSVSDPKTKRVVGSSPIVVQEDIVCEIQLGDFLQGVVFFNGHPISSGAFAYKKFGGDSAVVQISSEGKTEMEAWHEGSGFTVVPGQPLLDPAEVWEGDRELMMGAKVEQGVRNGSEVWIQVPSGVLVFPTSDHLIKYKVELKTSVFVTANLPIGPTGLNLTLPVGEYLITNDAGTKFKVDLQAGAIENLIENQVTE
jgi:RNA polymerase sigma factor (sigma-70 family)